MDFDLSLKILLIETSKRGSGASDHHSLVSLFSSEDDEDDDDRIPLSPSRTRRERKKKKEKPETKGKRNRHTRRRSGSLPEEPAPGTTSLRDSPQHPPHNSLNSGGTAISPSQKRRRRLSLGATIGRVVNMNPRGEKENLTRGKEPEQTKERDDHEKDREKQHEQRVLSTSSPSAISGWGGGEVTSRIVQCGNRRILLQFWVASSDGYVSRFNLFSATTMQTLRS